jgi:hypothetical protein
MEEAKCSGQALHFVKIVICASRVALTEYHYVSRQPMGWQVSRLFPQTRSDSPEHVLADVGLQ